MGILPNIPEGLDKVLEKVKHPFAFLAFFAFLYVGLFGAVLFAPIAASMKYPMLAVLLLLLVWMATSAQRFVTKKLNDENANQHVQKSWRIKSPFLTAEFELRSSANTDAKNSDIQSHTDADGSKQLEKGIEPPSGEGVGDVIKSDLAALAEQALELGHLRRADALFEILLEDESLGNKKRTEVAHRLGEMRFDHDTKGALEAFLKAIEHSPEDADAWIQIGHLYLRLGRLGEAKEAYDRALDIGTRSNDRYIVAASIGNLGTLQKALGAMDQAEQLYKDSLEIYEEISFDLGKANVYSNLAVIQTNRRDTEGAKQFIEKALEIYKRLESKENVADQLTNLGIQYQRLGDLDSAEAQYKKAVTLHEELGREEGLAASLGNLALLYRDKGDLINAEEALHKSLAISEQLGRQQGMATQYGNLGLIYGARGDFEKAEKMYRKALSINEKMGRKHGMAKQYYNLGLHFRSLGDNGAAKENLKRSKKLYLEMGLELDVRSIEEIISELDAVEPIEEE